MFKKVKYKEAYEMVKAKAYTLHPEGVNFVNTRKANKIINEARYNIGDYFLVTSLVIDAFLITSHFSLIFPQRLYREDYHKQKDKIHTTYDTPDIKQVKMNQEHLSDVCSGSLCHNFIMFMDYFFIIVVFCFLMISAVVQREILQQQGSVYLSAHHAPTDALLPRQ